MTQEMVVISGSADPLIVNIVITYVSIEHNHVYSEYCLMVYNCWYLGLSVACLISTVT